MGAIFNDDELKGWVLQKSSLWINDDFRPIRLRARFIHGPEGDFQPRTMFSMSTMDERALSEDFAINLLEQEFKRIMIENYE